MTKISLVVFEDSFGTAIFPTYDMFHFANELLKEKDRNEVFEVQLLGYKKKNINLSNRIMIRCDGKVGDPVGHELVILSPIHHTLIERLGDEYYSELKSWLREEHDRGVKIASMCSGVFMLADAGLLEDRMCTTNWMIADQLKMQCPHATLLSDNTMIKSDNIYTGGGGFNSMQLIFHLIEEYCGKDLAIELSKIVGIQYPVKKQNRFYLFRKQKMHRDEPILEIQDFMENNFNDNLRIEELANRVNMSPRNFIRRFKKATNETPHSYLQKIRIEVAKNAFESGESSVVEVMDKIGYQDLKSFSVLFKRETGLTPSAYARNYEEELLVGI